MINVASQATEGVKIPRRKATHIEIMRLFKENLVGLHQCLNVNLSLLFDLALTIIHRVLL